MKEEFKKIWEIALPYQDKRDDKGHAKIVTEYAIKICEIENADDNIVVPAAILHDIGWSQLPKEDWLAILNKSPEIQYAIRIKHQDAGVKLAEKILNEASYHPNFLNPILEIISQHDTRKSFFSNDDGAMRDADKLWRYSKVGFETDYKRNNFNFDFLYNELLRKIDEKNFFFFESSKEIARKELEKRKKKFMGKKINIT